MNTLVISALDDGVETKIGKLTFDENNNATLTVDQSGPQAERLKKVWEEAAKRDSLPLQWTDRKKVDGDTITARKSKNVSKSDPEYPDAVWSFLESENGFLVDKD